MSRRRGRGAATVAGFSRRIRLLGRETKDQTDNDLEVIMKNRITKIALVSFALATGAGADSFESLQTNGTPNPIEDAAGLFLPIHDGNQSEGEVLMIQGGVPAELNQQAVSDLWLFEDGTWSQISASAPRVSGHVLVAGFDGRAYAFGGNDPDDDGDLRELDEITVYEIRRVGGFLDVEIDKISVPGDHPGKCTDAAAVAIDDGRSILHIGGFCNWNVLDNGSREVWEYRIESNKWIRRADLPEGRMKHSAVVHREQVWVFGGDGPGGRVSDLFRYDPHDGRWYEMATVGGGPDPLARHQAVVSGDSMLVFGGIRSEFWPETTSEVWQLDFATLEWTRKADLPFGLAAMVADAMPTEITRGPNAQVMIFGGVIEPWSFPSLISDETLVYTSDARLEDLMFAVPAVARVRGRGAFFTSTLYLMNAGDDGLDIELTFTPRMGASGTPITIQYSLPSQRMDSIHDPLGALFGFAADDGGVGGLLVEVVRGSPNDLLIQTFVSAELESGEKYGTYFPAIRGDLALAASEVGYLTTTEDPLTYRVNVGLMALADATEIMVAPVSRVGERMASALGFKLDAGENLQINNIHDSFGIGPLADIMIEVAVGSGKAVAYATVLDGNGAYAGTSDPTTVQPVINGSGNVTLLEIGSIKGIDEFSGSATIVNLSDHQAEVRAEFFQRGFRGLTASRMLTFDPGEVVGYGDFVGQVFGIQDSVGTVVLKTLNGARIGATGREFANLRDEGDNRIIGTAGTQLPGLTDADLLMPDRTWNFIGLRQKMTDDERERSHLVVFNPGAVAARLTVSLFDGDSGASEGSRDWIIESQELIHINSVMKKIKVDVDGSEKRIEISVDQPILAQAFRVNTWGDSVTLRAE
jgi:hypothetical protein